MILGQGVRNAELADHKRGIQTSSLCCCCESFLRMTMHNARQAKLNCAERALPTCIRHHVGPMVRLFTMISRDSVSADPWQCLCCSPRASVSNPLAGRLPRVSFVKSEPCTAPPKKLPSCRSLRCHSRHMVEHVAVSAVKPP